MPRSADEAAARVVEPWTPRRPRPWSEFAGHAGYTLDVDLDQPGYIRAIVRRDGHATKVESVHDSDWRFMPILQDDRAGFVMHPVDLVVNKVLALAGRDEARDVLDTAPSASPRARAGSTVLGRLWQGPWLFAALSAGAASTPWPGAG